MRAPRTSCVCKTENDYNGSDTNGKTISSGVHDLIMWKLIGAVHKRSALTHTYSLFKARIYALHTCAQDLFKFYSLFSFSFLLLLLLFNVLWCDVIIDQSKYSSRCFRMCSCVREKTWIKCHMHSHGKQNTQYHYTLSHNETNKQQQRKLKQK